MACPWTQIVHVQEKAADCVQGPSNLSAAVVLSPLYSGLPYGKAISLLNNNTNSSLVQELQLGSLLTMAAVGSPGNQVCEVGELPGLSAPGQHLIQGSLKHGSCRGMCLMHSLRQRCEA